MTLRPRRAESPGAGAAGAGARLLGRRPVRLLVLGGAALLLAGCATEELPQNYLDPDGPYAVQLDNLWNLVFWIAVGVFVLVEAALLYTLFRFRARRGDDTLPKQVEGNTRLEVLWTLIPAVILASIAVPTVQTIFELTDRDPDALEVRVIAKQYWWEFEYPEEVSGGIITANELYIPVGRQVFLRMESVRLATAGDPLGVIHSFWVPKLAGKQDVVPGHERTMSILADEPGKWSGQCAEFCGLSHANMRFAVIALPPDEFERWAEVHSTPQSPPEEPLAALGYELFNERGCIGCHAVRGYEAVGPGEPGVAEGLARVGPDLTYFADREQFAGYTFPTNEENLRAWLDDPQEMKPGAQMPELQLSEEDITALVAYLLTLQSDEEFAP